MVAATHTGVPRLAARLTALIALATLAACATPGPNHPPDQPFDPYEQSNRKVHEFNVGLDKVVVRPAAKGYGAVVPDDIENAIARFATNLSLPGDVVNNILQLNMRAAFEDTARFAVNSTVGLGGLFDPATEMNMPAGSGTGFDETLDVWGVPQGAYVELPVFGPSTQRGTVGLVFDFLTNPFLYILDEPENYIAAGVSILPVLTRRDRNSDTIDALLYESADSYAAVRSIYLQNLRFGLGVDPGEGYTDPYDSPYARELAAGDGSESGGASDE